MKKFQVKSLLIAFREYEHRSILNLHADFCLSEQQTSQ